MTLDVLPLGVMIPVLPRIVPGFRDGNIAGVAELFGLFATLWGAMLFVCSPLLVVAAVIAGRATAPPRPADLNR